MKSQKPCHTMENLYFEGTSNCESKTIDNFH